MGNIKYIVYVGTQSSKPLVNSIKDAKQHAEKFKEYKQSLRIECYSSPMTACIWIYDYNLQAWIKTSNYQDNNLCCMTADCRP